MVYIIIIIIILIFISYFYKVRLKMTKKEEANVDLIISRFFNLRIDFDRLISQYLSFGNVKTTIQDVISGIKILLENRSLINEYMRRAKITKITVIPRWNVSDPVLNVYLIFMNWQLNSIIKAYLDKHFKEQLDQYYQVIIKNDGDSKGISFEFEMEIRFLTLLLVTIKNMIPIIKIIKTNKRSAKDERTPNK